MSEHTTSHSNLTDEEKKLYRERRQKGFRGQLGYANVHTTFKDEKGESHLVPLGYRKPRKQGAR